MADLHSIVTKILPGNEKQAERVLGVSVRINNVAAGLGGEGSNRLSPATFVVLSTLAYESLTIPLISIINVNKDHNLHTRKQRLCGSSWQGSAVP